MKFVDESGRFASMMDCPFGRMGSYMGFYCDGERFGRAYLYLATSHNSVKENRYKLFSLAPTMDGEKVPFALIMQPTELTVRTLYGDIRICFPERKLIYFRGDDGLGLKLYSTEQKFDRVTKPRGRTGFETVFPGTMTTVVHAVEGGLVCYAPWCYDENRTARTELDFIPDEQGHFFGTLEEFSHSGFVRDSYVPYDEGLAGVTAEWEEFRDNIDPLPGRYDALRERAAYNLWSYLRGECGFIRRPYLFMGSRNAASQWQTSFQSVAFGHNTKLGWDQMLTTFDYQSELGQTPDFYSDVVTIFANCRPPLMGWALHRMRQLGLYEALGKERIGEFYPKLARQAEFFEKYRTDGVDALPQYESADESGMEDGTTFRECPVMVTADLSAYIILIYEQLSMMARELGMDEAVSAEWDARADRLQERLIDRLWNGEAFEAHTLEGRTVDRDYGVLGYIPVILGKRLPGEIRSRLIADLKKEGYILSEYGFDKEKMTARSISDIAHNSFRGFIYHPINLLLISGLYDCGEEAFASEVASRYCGAMADADNLCQNITAFSGACPGGEWLSWTAGCYMLIAAYIKE